MKVNGKDDIPDMKWKIYSKMFESTNQIYHNIIAITIQTSIYKGFIADIKVTFESTNQSNHSYPGEAKVIPSFGSRFSITGDGSTHARAKRYVA